MRNLLRDLRSAWWDFIHPAWDEPERDETTPQAIATWIAGHKHPDACNRGCQCQSGRGEGVT